MSAPAGGCGAGGYRARVLSVTTDEAADRVTYGVLFTDVGDQATVDESLVLPLPERFAKRLPLQVSCETVLPSSVVLPLPERFAKRLQVSCETVLPSSVVLPLPERFAKRLPLQVRL